MCSTPSISRSALCGTTTARRQQKGNERGDTGQDNGEEQGRLVALLVDDAANIVAVLLCLNSLAVFEIPNFSNSSVPR